MTKKGFLLTLRRFGRNFRSFVRGALLPAAGNRQSILRWSYSASSSLTNGLTGSATCSSTSQNLDWSSLVANLPTWRQTFNSLPNRHFLLIVENNLSLLYGMVE